MNWLNPWAWLGLSALAVPVLVHLLARRRARPLPFPTLRFLGAPHSVLARRDRLSDIVLLLVRAGIVAAAVAALAQPYLLTRHRRQTLETTRARAILVDAGASMARSGPAGGTALDAARREALRLAGETPTSSVRESANIGRELDGQIAWLDAQAARRELVVISDFQTSAISEADLAVVPADIGLRFIRIGVIADTRPLEISSTLGDVETTARLTVTSSDTTVEWGARSRPGTVGATNPILLAGDVERPRAEAARAAARTTSPASPRADQPVAIVFPGFADRGLLIKDAAPLTESWMFDVVATLRRDATLQQVARTTAVSPSAEGPSAADLAAADQSSVRPTSFTLVATDAGNRPLIVAAGGRADGRSRLLLISWADAGSLTSAALIAGVERALSPVAITPEELDPTTIPDETLLRWERAPGSIDTPPRSNDPRESDGRWFWIGALGLLVAETWMRRRRKDAPVAAEVDHARVA